MLLLEYSQMVTFKKGCVKIYWHFGLVLVR
jgi:hypothetical protein